MNLVRQMMPGHNQCEITNSRMSIEERVVNEVFGLAMTGGTPTVNGHYNPHAANHYPRRAVGHDHLPERTTANGSTFYVRHCVFNFGTNDLSFDFALSEDNHDLFLTWSKEFIEESLTYVFMSMLRNHTRRIREFKISIKDHISELRNRDVRIFFDGFKITDRPAMIGMHRTKSRRLLYRASFHIGPRFQIGKPSVAAFEL